MSKDTCSALEQKKQFDKLAEVLGSQYAACMYLARVARHQRTILKYLVSESEAITVALIGELPETYHERKKVKSRILQRIEDILNYVEDKEVEAAARDSFRTSVDYDHLVYNYMKINDVNRQARVRILTRMMFYKFKEDNTHG